MSEILKNLNLQQIEAVTAVDGPVLIIAGAGSGKTRALTHRAAYLIERGVPPQNILALTFTNKAAGEMKKRVLQLTNPSTKLGASNLGFIGTFHAFAAKVLRREIQGLGYGNNFVIYDENDALAAVKEVLADLALNPDQFKPAALAAAISKQKNELTDARSYAEKAADHYQKTVALVFQKYEDYLKEANAVDFDDLLLLTVKLFLKSPATLEKYQSQFKYILVDEYQDTNHAQYVLLKLLAQKHQNLCVVGDDWQCLPAGVKVATPQGLKNIETIKPGQMVIGGNGGGNSGTAAVNEIKKRQYRGKIVKVKTRSGRVLKLTPQHAVFIRLPVKMNGYFVYLMFSSRFGYRIGLAKGARNDGRAIQIGLRVRANQERADKMWVLKMASTREQALYWEQYFAFRYGIPTTVFLAAANRSMKFTQKMISDLYRAIPSAQRARKLMADLGLMENHPHFLPQGTNRHGTQKLRLNLTLFGDNRKSKTSPWGLSRFSINSTDQKLGQVLKSAGFNVRKGKYRDWRVESSRLNYEEAEQMIEKIKIVLNKAGKNAEVIRRAALTKGKPFLIQPAANLLEGMIIPICAENQIREDEIVKVKKEEYDGLVHDLNVFWLHNYAANGIVVHNSIYGFRQADFRNILNFEKDYPGAKVVLLEENYRSVQNILDAAGAVIAKNNYRTEKKLWTRRSAGEKIKIIQAANEVEEGLFIIQEIKKILARDTPIARDLNDFVILYRVNAQSRALEEAVLEEGWPYRLVGGTKFYERREIKDVLCYLRFIQNDKDFISLKRIINTPPRGLGKSAWEKVALAGSLESVGQPKILEFARLVAGLREESRQKNLTDFVKTLLQKTQYQNYTLDGTSEGETRWENVRELLTVAAKFNHLKPPEGLDALLEEIALTSSADVKSRGDHVALRDDVSEENGVLNLMTLHAAKGLEFPVVFIAGAEEGLLPHSRSAWDAAQLEEERRLAYVGLTRAKDKAYFIFTRRRNIYGRSEAALPSRFLNDIPGGLAEYKEYDPMEAGEEILEI